LFAGIEESQVYADEAFINLIKDELNVLGTNNKLSGLEKPKEITLTKEMFSVENNLLTPTFKLKRHVAREFFKPQIEAMYKKLEQKGFV